MRFLTRPRRSGPQPIAFLRRHRCRLRIARHGRLLARFGNALTARNPTHRAVTNATFTSGCVHGHRAWFRRLRSDCWYPRAVQVLNLAASLQVQRSAPRPSPALRSSISSEGSLLFVVCPSRISTHSVSENETAHYSPSACRFLPLPLVLISPRARRRLSPSPPSPSLPRARRPSRTRTIKPSTVVVYRVYSPQRGGGAPLVPIKMATALLARATALLASSCAIIRPGDPLRGISLSHL